MEVERRVRWYQRELHEYMVRGGKRAIAICHRRWGKDEMALAATCEIAHQRIASYWHCLPEYEQARKALWDAVNARTGKRRIDEAFPPEIRASKDEQKMFIKLKCGSTWQLIGSDRFDATVGSGAAGIVYSEWAQANPGAWIYHRPMLAENNGFAMFITTPRGRNHAHKMYQDAVNDPDWFATLQSIAYTREPIDLAKARAEYEMVYGAEHADALIRQEYFCDFNAGILGAIYAREMQMVREEGRIVADIAPLPDRPVHAAWDIGVHDDTSVWWFQVVGAQVFVFDCASASGRGIDHWAAISEEKAREHGWRRGSDFVPHDASQRQWVLAGAKTVIQQMLQYGFNPQPCPNATLVNGIAATRKTLARTVFHERCERSPEGHADRWGLAALEQYQREWDDDAKTFTAKPLHDWSSHFADAFRYLSLSWTNAPRDPVRIVETPPPGMIRPPPVPESRGTRTRL